MVDHMDHFTLACLQVTQPPSVPLVCIALHSNQLSTRRRLIFHPPSNHVLVNRGMAL